MENKKCFKPPTRIYMILVGGLKHFLFSIIYGIILHIDELIFFKMVIAPPTKYSYMHI
jgi:hypothetical protein